MKKVAVLQIDSVLGDQQANLDKIDRMLTEIDDPDVRLAVFCEYGLSGYCTDLLKIAEPIPGKITDALCELAKKHDIWLAGGLPERANDTKIANALVMVSPKGGLVAKYRKIHPFSSEQDIIESGTEPVVVDTEVGKVGLSICYDFMFPELTRGLKLKGADILLCSTFWFADDWSKPMGWGPQQALAMSRIRALENRSYVIMACRTGVERDGDNILNAFGHSSICDPMGCIVAQAQLGETVIKAEIDADWLKYCNDTGCVQDRRPEIYRKVLDI